jgi:hypothetical protein
LPRTLNRGTRNMKQKDKSEFIRKIFVNPVAAACALLSVIAVMPAAHAEKDAAAIKTLKAMSDYVAGQKTLLVTFDSDVEVITSDLQKLQFTSSGQIQLSRPDKLRASRTSISRSETPMPIGRFGSSLVLVRFRTNI